MKNFIVILSAFLITGCATNDYALYAEAQKSMAQSRAIAEAAKYNALAEIAKSGDSAAKVAAVISINFGQSGNTQPQSSIAAPKTFGETALQWTSILLPSITQIYGINKNSEVSISQSNNAALVAKSTNEAFVGISSKIQAPQANVVTTTNNSDSSNRSVNTTTTSSVGRDNNTGANSGNTGRVAGGNLTDNTSTPTVVKPEVVNTTTTTTTTTTTNNSSNNTSGTTGP